MELEKRAERLGREKVELESRRVAALTERERCRTDQLETQKSLRLAELALREAERKLRELDRRPIANASQANALEAERVALTARQAKAEEEWLAAMERCEAGERALERQKTALETLERSLGKRQEELQANDIELDGDRKAVLGMLDHLRDGVGKNWLAAYESIRRSPLPPPYVCRLEGLKCSGCHMHMAANAMDSSNSDLRRCEFCNRLIYRDSPEEGKEDEI
jgi:predicted  nucleic acid-binding Zn-ribbon protein